MAMKDYIALAERQTGHKIRCIRSDGGGEFWSTEWTRYVSERGIEHIRTPPDAHAQNGRVERVHLTVLDGVRTTLIQSGLPATFWAEAANYVVYTRNRTPCGPQHLVPEDSWRGREVPLEHMHPFGCTVYFRDHRKPSKIAPRYLEGKLMGYVEGTTTYRVWDAQRRNVVLTRDIIFPDQSPPQIDETNATVPLLQDLSEPVGAVVTIDDDAENEPVEPANIDQARPAAPVTPPQSLARPVRERRAPRQWDESRAVPTAPRRPVGERWEYINESVENGQELAENDQQAYLAEAYAYSAFSTPQSYRDAKNSGEWEHWQPAMKAELAKMDQYKVWDVVDRQPSMRVIGAKWVYTRKIDGETGKPKGYKARWVAKGYTQIEGVDFNELYASVAHKDSIRVFLSLVNYLDLECDQVDIKAAFLNGDLKETLFLSPPEGSDIPANKVLLLRKSLYGLKQSPRCFNDALDEWLRSQGLNPTNADPCVYTRRRGGEFLLLSVHVDDQLIACNTRTSLDEFKRQLNAKFECSDSGAVGYFLGFNVHRDRPNRKLYISQEHYLQALLERFGMETSNPARNPLPSGFKALPATDEEAEAARHHAYPQLVGSILYASTVSRPDLSHAAGVLSRFVSKWNETHWAAAKHLLRYIRGTTELCLTFDGEAGKRIVLGYADADWGGDLDTRRSTTGYLFKTFGGVVAWKSRRQATVALSTTEAEYMASADATRQAIWLRQLLDDLQMGLKDGEAVSILNDNAGAIALSKNPVHHNRSKHIALRHHFLREQVTEGMVDLAHIPSVDNLADLLTKPLPRDTFDRLRGRIGLSPRMTRSLRSEE
jgi:hypothetical protein